MQVLSRVTRLAHHLDRARQQAFTAHHLTSWEFDVLAALRRAGDPYALSPGRLLRETLVTSGTMTNRIDRLSVKGLVTREPDPHDRRGVIVRLSGEGKHRVDAALQSLLDREESLLADLTPRQRETLGGLLRAVTAPLDA